MKIPAVVARLLVGLPPPQSRERQEALAALERMPAFMPRENPLESEEGEESRRNAALRIVDGDTFGFLLLTVHRDPDGVRGHIELAANLRPEWWPAVIVTLRRVIAAHRDTIVRR